MKSLYLLMFLAICYLQFAVGRRNQRPQCARQNALSFTDCTMDPKDTCGRYRKKIKLFKGAYLRAKDIKLSREGYKITIGVPFKSALLIFHSDKAEQKNAEPFGPTFTLTDLKGKKINDRIFRFVNCFTGEPAAATIDESTKNPISLNFVTNHNNFYPPESITIDVMVFTHTNGSKNNVVWQIPRTRCEFDAKTGKFPCNVVV